MSLLIDKLFDIIKIELLIHKFCNEFVYHDRKLIIQQGIVEIVKCHEFRKTIYLTRAISFKQYHLWFNRTTPF